MRWARESVWVRARRERVNVRVHIAQRKRRANAHACARTRTHARTYTHIARASFKFACPRTLIRRLSDSVERACAGALQRWDQTVSRVLVPVQIAEW